MGMVYKASIAQNVTLDGAGRVALWFGVSPTNYLQRLLCLTITMDDAGDSNENRYITSIVHTAAAASGTSITPAPMSTGASAYPAGGIRKAGTYSFSTAAIQMNFSSLTGVIWRPMSHERFIWGGSPSKNMQVRLSGGVDHASEERYLESTLTFEVLGG